MTRLRLCQPLIAPLVGLAAALVASAAGTSHAAADASTIPATASPGPPLAVAQAPGQRSPVPSPSADEVQATYLRECLGKGAVTSQRRAYCQCSYLQLRRRYTPQHYALLDGWIRSGPPEVRRFALVAWEPEFAACRPLLQSGSAVVVPRDAPPAAAK